MSLTDKLAALDSLHAAATQGEWYASVTAYPDHNRVVSLIKAKNAECVAVALRVEDEADKHSQTRLEDLQSIAALHNAYPELAAELRRLADENRALRAHVERLRARLEEDRTYLKYDKKHRSHRDYAEVSVDELDERI